MSKRFKCVKRDCEGWLTRNLRDPEFAAAYQHECDVDARLAALKAAVVEAAMAWDGALHLVPLDDIKDGRMGLAITERPTLCGVFVAHSGGGTIQPDLVTCWPCMIAYERSVMGPRAAQD